MNRKLGIYLFLLLLFCAPSKLGAIEQSAQLESTVISTSYYDIDNDGKKEIIEIVLTKGIKVRDQEPWCGEGERWEGEFIAQVRKEKNILAQFNLNKYIDKEGSRGVLSFWGPNFSLVFNNYNNDGDVDFNLGQYTICAGNDYWLFTIRRNGIIEPLPFDGSAPSIFVPNAGPHNSTDIIQMEDKMIKSSFYNRDEEIEYIDWYKWTGEKFIIAKHKEISNKKPLKAK